MRTTLQRTVQDLRADMKSINYDDVVPAIYASLISSSSDTGAHWPEGLSTKVTSLSM